MTTPTQRSSEAAASVQQAATNRQASLASADAERGVAYVEANRAFVARVRPIVDAGELTVAEAAKAANIARQRMYQLLRQFPDGDAS